MTRAEFDRERLIEIFAEEEETLTNNNLSLFFDHVVNSHKGSIDAILEFFIDELKINPLSYMSNVRGDIYRGSTRITKLVIPKNSLTISNGAFSDMKNLEEVIFETGNPKNIPDQCFANCPNLKNVMIQNNSVGNIGRECFKGDDSVKVLWDPNMNPNSFPHIQENEVEWYDSHGGFFN